MRLLEKIFSLKDLTLVFIIFSQAAANFNAFNSFVKKEDKLLTPSK